MSKTKVTRTTNPLPFSDLEPRRFEDLALNLIYPSRSWADIQPYGRSGSDDGQDVWARETLEDTSDREWIIQCRRYKRAAKAELVKAVDDAIARLNQPPAVLLVVVACDISKASHEAYVRYAHKMGVETPLLWPKSILEAKLYSERPDLLLTYFDISIVREERRKETTVRRNLTLKRRLLRIFKYDETPDVIIHSIDDDTYPGNDESQKTGISPWFRLEFRGHYHGGIEVLLRVETVILDSDGKWAVIDEYPETREPGMLYSHVNQDIYDVVNCFRIGRIPFRNIVEVDEIGDEYYGCPHLYCRFADDGMPYEEFLYQPTGDGHQPTMPENQRFPFKNRKR